MAVFKTLPTRRLGNGPLVPRLGLGLMGASDTYGNSLTDEEKLDFLDEAYKRGQRFWDTGELSKRCRCEQTILKPSRSRQVRRLRRHPREMVCCKP